MEGVVCDHVGRQPSKSIGGARDDGRWAAAGGGCLHHHRVEDGEQREQEEARQREPQKTASIEGEEAEEKLLNCLYYLNGVICVQLVS